MTLVNIVSDQGHRLVNSGRRPRLALGVGGVGFMAALAGIGVDAFVAGAAARPATQRAHVHTVAGQAHRPLAPNARRSSELRAELGDDWPWKPAQPAPAASIVI
jgi:hypothetical protein